MTTSNRIDGDLAVTGQLTPQRFKAPVGSIDNNAIEALAGIDATKLEHQLIIPIELFGPAVSVTAVTKAIYIAHGDGSIVSVEAIVQTPADHSSRTISIDLKKGASGVAYATVLSAPLAFANTTLAKEVVAGTLVTEDYSDGDSFELVVAVSGSSGAQALGLLVVITVREEAN